MEVGDLSTAAHACNATIRRIYHQNPKAAIALEDGVHHNSVAEFKDVEGESPPRKQNNLWEREKGEFSNRNR
jgi:hypothetical protein